jgi:hypothetical protein
MLSSGGKNNPAQHGENMKISSTTKALLDGPKEGEYQCEICSKIFVEKTWFERHAEIKCKPNPRIERAKAALEKAQKEEQQKAWDAKVTTIRYKDYVENLKKQ